MDRDAVNDWGELRGVLTDAGARPDELAAYDAFVTRRRFLGLAGRGSLAALLAGFGAGTDALFEGLFGRGLIPQAWAEPGDDTDGIPGKPGMFVHMAHPMTGEFPPHLLDDDVTPTARHFVRNNGAVPSRSSSGNTADWTLTIDGEVEQPLTLSLDDLKAMPSVTLPLLIECAGNGRALFVPRVRGNPWRRGAVACSAWTGVRLRDILKRAGLKSRAVHTAHYGDDAALGSAEAFSRGIPLAKAMDEHTLVAYGMNGGPISPLNGAPLRLVVPGWVGSASQKWLTRIQVRDREHDSKKMTGYSYRIPRHPVEPGTRPPESDMVVATSWGIKSMITRPTARAELPRHKVVVAGHAWAGEGRVDAVKVSTDYGISWRAATLKPPPNRFAWARWDVALDFPGRGYYEIWARAFDADGVGQPLRQPWNPKGYLGNVIHRLPVTVST